MKNKFFLSWICFHALILFSFLISLLFAPKINFSTSLFDILPPSSGLREVQLADSRLAERTGRAVTILVKADSFELAKEAAEKFYFTYADAEGRVEPEFFDSLSLFVDASSIQEITAWLHQNRFFLLDQEIRNLLTNGAADEIAGEALASAYGAFNFSDLSYLDQDPFLLSERSLKNFLEGGMISSTNMALRDDILAAEKDGEFYVLIRAGISAKGASLTGKKRAVKSIYKTCETLRRNYGYDGKEVRFIFSGVPFHSYENAASAQRQISIISTLALLLIVLAFLWIFRSLVPALVSALAVAFSCGIGFVSVLLFFRGIHILTFVFGTTLIGTCLDYSIHFFVKWKSPDCTSGAQARNSIMRGITLSFISSEVCIAALFFAPFPLLKQVSVFLMAGLATAYLSVVALYPMIPLPLQKNSPSAKKLFVPKIPGKVTVLVPLILVLFSLLVIVKNYRSFVIKNDIRSLYSMSGEMMQNEITCAQVLNTGSSGWYFMLKADSQEELLQLNEKACDFLEQTIGRLKKGSFLSVSQFIPSEKVQRSSWLAAEKLVALAPAQYQALGFDESEVEEICAQYENNYRSLEGHFIHPSDSNLPKVIKDALASLWIGELEGHFYSCLLPLHLNGSETESLFREYAGSNPGIFFVNKTADISSQLDLLSKSMLKILALAFVVVLAILLFCYPPLVVLKIAAIPFTVTIVTSAVLILCRVSLSFFPVTALVLVFGLGLDYVIYAIEGKKSSSFAILLSFVTTALSFGALALSTFPPVHTLGLTVFAGLTTALVTALCLTKN